MKFTDRLNEMNACPDAVKWVGRRGLMTAWRDCKRADWMLWLAGSLDIDRKLLVLAACDCAETALQYVPEGEDRPAKAIQVSRNWCGGTAFIGDVRNAAYAAANAVYAAANATHAATNAAHAAAHAATHAVYAAANAATYATCATYAADAAYAATNAAYAATNAATYAAARKTCVDLVRKRIPFDVISKAWSKQ